MGATAGIIGAVGATASAAKSLSSGGKGGGGGSSAEADYQNLLLRQQAQNLWDTLKVPEFDTSHGYQQQKWLADYKPETYTPDTSLPFTQMSDDAASLEAQKKSLGQLQDLAKGGLNAADMISLNQILGSQTGAATSAYRSAADQLAARGLSGSGADYAAKIAANQQSGNQASTLYDQAFKDAMNRQVAAIQSSGNMAGNMRQESANISQQMAQMANTWNTNIMNVRTNAAMNSANVRNAAQQYNLTGQQNVANQNVGLANTWQDTLRQIQQQTFQDQQAKIGGQAGALTGQEQYFGAAAAAADRRAQGADQSTQAGLGQLANAGKMIANSGAFDKGGMFDFHSSSSGAEPSDYVSDSNQGVYMPGQEGFVDSGSWDTSGYAEGGLVDDEDGATTTPVPSLDEPAQQPDWVPQMQQVAENQPQPDGPSGGLMTDAPTPQDATVRFAKPAPPAVPGRSAADAIATGMRAGPQSAPPAAGEAPPKTRYTVDQVFRAIVGTEGSRQDQTSPKGATGKAQMMPATFARYAQPGEDIHNEGDNMRVAKRMVTDLYQKYGGDPARIATAYFSGEGNVNPDPKGSPWMANKGDGNMPTSQYVSSVLGRLGAKPDSSWDSSTEADQGGSKGGKGGDMFADWDAKINAFRSGQQPILDKMEALRQDYLKQTKPSIWDQFGDSMREWSMAQNAANANLHSSAGSILMNAPVNPEPFQRALESQQATEQKARDTANSRARDLATMGTEAAKSELQTNYQAMGMNADEAKARAEYDVHMKQQGIDTQRVGIEKERADTEKSGVELRAKELGAKLDADVDSYLKESVPNDTTRAVIAQEYREQVKDDMTPQEKRALIADLAKQHKDAGDQISTKEPAQYQLISYTDPNTGKTAWDTVNLGTREGQARNDELKKMPGYHPQSMQAPQYSFSPTVNSGSGSGEGGHAGGGPDDQLQQITMARGNIQTARTLLKAIRDSGETIGPLQDSPIGRRFLDMAREMGFTGNKTTLHDLWTKVMSQIQTSQVLPQLKAFGGKSSTAEYNTLLNGQIGSDYDPDAAEIFLDHLDQSGDWMQRQITEGVAAGATAKRERNEAFNPLEWRTDWLAKPENAPPVMKIPEKVLHPGGGKTGPLPIQRSPGPAAAVTPAPAAATTPAPASTPAPAPAASASAPKPAPFQDGQTQTDLDGAVYRYNATSGRWDMISPPTNVVRGTD